MDLEVFGDIFLTSPGGFLKFPEFFGHRLEGFFGISRVFLASPGGFLASPFS